MERHLLTRSIFEMDLGVRNWTVPKNGDDGGNRHDASGQHRCFNHCVQEARLSTLELAETGDEKALVGDALSQRPRLALDAAAIQPSRDFD